MSLLRRALPRVLPPLLDGPQSPRDGFATCIAQVRVGDRFHLHHRVDAGRIEALSNCDERVWVDFSGHVRVRVVHLEVILDAGRRVLKVHDHGRGLAGVGAIEAREGLHCRNARQFFIHVHGDEGTNVCVALRVDVGVHCLEPAVGLAA